VSETDAELILRVRQRGDANAFAELVRRYQSAVRSFVRGMTRGDAHVADDIAQETFLRAWRRIGSFKGESRFSTWLLAIAYNEFRTQARRRKMVTWAGADEMAARREDPAAGGAKDLRLDIAEALKGLEEGERAAIALCYQQGLTHAEAAQVLGCPLGTVKTHILRGKEKLRRRLSL